MKLTADVHEIEWTFEHHIDHKPCRLCGRKINGVAGHLKMYEGANYRLLACEKCISGSMFIQHPGDDLGTKIRLGDRFYLATRDQHFILADVGGPEAEQEYVALVSLDYGQRLTGESFPVGDSFNITVGEWKKITNNVKEIVKESK